MLICSLCVVIVDRGSTYVQALQISRSAPAMVQSNCVVPVEKLLTRLKAVANHLAEEYKEQPWMLEQWGASKNIVQTNMGL